MLKEVVVMGLEEKGNVSKPAPWLKDEFPTVKVTLGDASDRVDLCVDVNEFHDPAFDFWAFDRRLDELVSHPFTLGVMANDGDPWEAAEEVLTRAQRCIARRNAHSEGKVFDSVLVAHRSLYELDKPLVKADYDHALDAWQWTLRLDSNASAAVQMAALFHDIERLLTEADERIEADAADYQGFKDAHARAGAEIVRACLRESSLDLMLEKRVCDLVANHERLGDDEERRLLGDADALSFFSFNSPGFIDYFGEEHTRKKIRYTLRRLSPKARKRLASLRLREDVAELLRACSLEAMG